ncbi:hypothetical protein IH781_00860 [Patescibacteria group bacterium]|nr:hypothetical protein [Patescibacteria group bacterium]
MADDFEDDNGGILKRLKESPRTVSALIIILIVAAAIYAFSGDGDQSQADISADEFDGAIAEELATAEATDDGELDDDDKSGETAGTKTTSVSQTELVEETQAMPKATRSDNSFVEVAEAGDGITHLARRAATRWLSENQAGYDVTNEHRIFIEDFIQNRIGSEGLEIGDTKSIEFSLVADAVTAAGRLSDTELSNLTQYTYVFN